MSAPKWLAWKARRVSTGLLLALAAAGLVAFLAIVVVAYVGLREKIEIARARELEVYVVEHARFEAQRFARAQEAQAAARAAFLQRRAAIDQADAVRRFHSAFPRHGDGTRRSSDELFDGVSAGAGYTYGIGAFVAAPERLSEADKADLMAAFDVVRTFGPALAPTLDNFYFYTPHNRLIIFAPSRADRLRFYRSDAPANFSFQDEEVAQIVSTSVNPHARMACTGLRPLLSDPSGQTMTTGCHTPVDLGGARVGAFGTSFTLERGMRSALDDRLAYAINVYLDRDGALLAHPQLLGARPSPKSQVEADFAIAHLADRTRATRAGVLRDAHPDFLVAFARIDGPQWTLLVYMPRALIVAEARDAVLPILAWAIAAALGLVLVAYLVARSAIVEPIERLTRMSQAQGHADLDLLVARPDELGALARALRERDRRLHNLIQHQADLVEARTSALSRALAFKSKFLSDVAHELRTPLNGILALAHALAQRPLEQTDAEMAATIADASGQLRRVVDDLLDQKGLATGVVKIEHAKFSLSQTAKAISQLYTPLAQAKGLTLRLDCSSMENASWVHGDDARVRQVLSNLVHNAIKFTPAGYVRLSCARIDDDWVEFEVADSGPGLAQDLAQAPFARFGVGDAPGAGAGLGLAIVDELCTGMGGVLRAGSTLDRGALFIAALPLSRATALECEAPSPVTGEAEILVVDDDRLSARVAEIVLAAAGFKVTTMAQAKVDDLLAVRCDVMMLDRRLGRADGVELALAFRNVESATTPRRIIILVTADTEELDQTMLAAAGIDAVVRKPYTPTDLLSALDRARGPSVRRAHAALG